MNFKKLLFFLFVCTSILSKAQVVINQETFESVVGELGYTVGTGSGTIGTVTGNSSGTVTPNGVPMFTSTTRGYRMANVTATGRNIDFGTLTGLGAYTSKYVTLRLASFSGTTGNGAETADFANISISFNNGSTWSSELRVTGNNNTRWDFSGSGTASTTYDGDNTPASSVSPAGATGLSTMRVNLPDTCTSVKIRVTLANNSADELWVIDDLKVFGTSAPTGASTITAGGGTEPATISSLVNTLGTSALNFDFTITDDGATPSTDALSTLISQIIIGQGTGNDVSDWTQAIAGAQLSDGTNTLAGIVGATGITFASIPNGSGQLGNIADNGNKTYTLRVWLNSTLGGSLPTTADGLNLVFDVSNSSFSFSGSSSAFAASQAQNSGSANNAISVVATSLTFTTQPAPTTIGVGATFTTSGVVTARDANGNTDLGFNFAATVTNAGSISMSNAPTTFASGVLTFPGGFIYNATGNGTLTVSANSLNGTSTTITVINAPYGIFSNVITDTNPSADNPYTNGQVVNSNITATGIGRGTGISAASASNRYSASGWSTAGLLTTDYFTFTLTPNSGYEIDFTDFEYTGQVSSGSPNLVFRSSLDGFTANIGSMNSSGTTIDLSGAAYQDITTAIEFRVYGYGFASGSATFSINDFAFHGFVNLVPVGASTLTAGGGAEPATLSSLVTTLGGSSLNFDFTVNDDATNNAIDAANTLISQIVINQGTGNDVATWTQAIAGAQLTDGTNTLNGTVGATSITFSSIPFGSGQLGYIADNASKTYTLKVWLNTTMGGSLPSTIDGLNLVFDVDNASFTLQPASSLLAANQTQNSGATNNAVSVVASALTFITQASPTTINTNQVFTTLPVVEARDANGNRDLGYNNNATVTTVGGLSFSGASAAFVSGLYNFTTFQYTSPGNGTLTVTGSGSPATTATNNCVTITVVAGPCVDEGFAGGTTAPPGWTFTAIGGTYTTSSNFGNASPSLQFDNTDDAITTPVVTNPTQLSFWYKGQNSTNSYLLVQGLIGSTWVLIDSIRPLATTGTNVSYAISNPYTQFKLTYKRSTGNLALDDVNVLCSSTVVPTNYYQSNVTAGNWDAAGSWQTSTDNVNWVAATAAPDFNANTITIRNGHTITIAQGVTTDQTVVAAGGTLVINPTVIFVLNDGTGVDLIVNGTLNDKSTGSNGQYISGSDPRWELGANGTFIKEGNSSANVWQCTYQGADGNCRNSAIPATSTWIVRQTGSAVTLSSTYAYYGNLIIENTSGNAWNGNLSQGFQGGTSSEAPVIKGNLDVGGTGSNTVSFNIANTNTNPVRVDGNVTVRNGSSLNLGTSGQTSTGIEVKGNINLSTSGNLTYGSSSGSNRQLRLTGTAQQTISGGSTVNILNMLVSNTSTQSVVMGRNIKVDNQLTLNTGSKLNVNGYTLELAGTITGTGTLSGSNTSVLDITGSGALGTLYFTQTANTFRTVSLNKTSGSATIGSGLNTLNIYQNLNLEAGTLTTNGNLTTLSSALQTAYIDDFSAGFAGTISGNVKVERYITSGPNGFRYIGTPVATTSGGSTLALSAISGFVISGTPGQLVPLPTCSPTNSALNSPYGTFMRWEEAGPFMYNCRQAGWWFQTTGTMTVGRGYGAKLSGGNKLIYTGAANTGSKSYGPLANSGPVGNGWHLVSNPYPSAMAISNVDADVNNNMPTGFHPEIQLYVTSGPYTGSYLAYQTNLATAPFALGQGFWVRSLSSATFTLTNSYRVTNQVTYYDVNTTVQQHLKVDVAGNDFMDKTDIYFLPQAQSGFDLYDAEKWESRAGQPTLYTTVGNQMTAINSLPSLTEAVAIPMGVKPGTSGEFTFTFSDIASFPQSAMIYLEDLKDNTMTDLRANNNYVFTANTNDDPARFMLHFKPGVQVEVADQDCDNAGSIEVVQPSSTVWSSYNLKDNNGTVYAQGTNFSGSFTVNGLQPQEYILTLTHTSGYIAQEFITVNGTSVVSAAITASATNVQVDEAVNFTATANNATELVWNLGDGTIVTGTNTVQHIYGANGTYNVTLTAQNDVCNDVAYKTIVVGNTTGIADADAGALKIYGQGNHLVIEFTNILNNKANISVFNMLGQKVESFTGVSTLNGRSEVMLTDIKPGYYSVQVLTGNQVVNQKIYLGTN